jgi:cell division septation protein DedD
METKCPTCGLARTVDAASPESGEEQMCDPCASSYKALLSEIELRAADRRADAAPDADAATSAALALTSADGGAGAALLPSGGEASSRGGQTAADADDYALGVSIYRVPAAGLIAVGACLFAVLFLAGWLKKPAGVVELDAAAESVAVRNAVDQRGAAAPAPAVADASLSPAASHAPTVVTIAEPVAEEKAEATADELEESDEAELTQEELEAEEREEAAGAPATRPAASAVEGGRFTIQVGSYNKAEEAEGRASILRAAGFDAHVAAVEIPKKGTWFRVQSGRFQTREQAALYEKSLRASGASDATFVAEVAN